MQQRFLTLLLILCISASVQAQITVTNASFLAANDTLRQYVDTAAVGVSVTAPGTNQNWDFTQLALHRTDVNIVAPASSGADFSMFPTSQILVPLAGFVGYASVTSTAVNVQGIGVGNLGVPGVPTAFALSPSWFKTQRAPLTYGNNFNNPATGFRYSLLLSTIPFLDSTINANIPIPGTHADSLRVVFSIKRTENVDAWGNCNTPVGSYNTVRSHKTDITDTKAEVHLTSVFGAFWLDVSTFLPTSGLPLGKDTTQTYEFLDATSKVPIVTFSPNKTTGAVKLVKYKYGVITGIQQPNNDGGPKVTLFPNPATQTLNIQVGANLTTGTYYLTIYNVVGKEIQRARHELSAGSRVQTDVSQLPQGIYLMSIQDAYGNTLFTGRFTKTQP